jgi:hypothetical protein
MKIAVYFSFSELENDAVYNKLLGLGVDKYITNEPELLKVYLNR